MLQYLILILFVLTTLGQGVNLYQQQPPLLQPSQAEALLAQSSNAALMTSQASSTIQAASLAAATTASIASALTGNGVLQSYPYQVNSDSLLEWNQFAILAWELNNNANFDLWASKQFNNAWIGDLGMTSPVQLQLPSWVDASSQSQWNVWAQILCAQRNLNSLNMGNGLGGNSAQLLQNGLGLSSSANGLLSAGLSNNGNGLLASGFSNGANGLASSLANGANGLLASSFANGANGLLASSLANGANGLLASSLANGANGLLASSLSNGANGLLASGLANNGLLSSNWNSLSNGNSFGYNGLFVGSQPSGTGPWSGQYSGWTQNNGVWYGNNGAGWYQDGKGDWYTMNSNANNYGAGSINGVFVGPQPTGTGPWTGHYTGWTQNNDWWYENSNKGVGWYKDNTNNWYMNNQYNANGYNNGFGSGYNNGVASGYSNGVASGYNNGVGSGFGNGVYVGPQPTGSGPWNGQVTGWTQRSGKWYDNNGAAWYKDNVGHWYTSNNNGNTGSGYQGNNWYNNNNNGVYVGPQPTGSGPWNGQYTGWNQNNGMWYNGNSGNGVGWYKDNTGNWYTSNSNGNTGSGYQANWSNNNNGVYVGPQPTGSGPWNGQYTGWNQNNGMWYNVNNGNGVGWYKDNTGNWYTSNSNGNTGSGYQANWYNNLNGVFVGPRPTGSGPWNGQYTGWNQNNGQWYNSNGVGWYQDNTGNWYSSNNGNNGINGVGLGKGIYVGPQPTGMGPWNGQYAGWTQRGDWWYNSNGDGWYQDNMGNWYTSSGMNPMLNGMGEGQGFGGLGSTSTQCVATTVGQMNATLTCPPSTVIVSVLGAAYGNTPGSCPSNVNTMNPSCTLNVTQLIQKSCQGQNQCSVTVQPNILGAPTNNGQQCSTVANSGPFATSNQYTLVARYTCGIAGPGGLGIGGLNSTSLTFSPPNSASSVSYAASLILASLLAAMFSIL